MEQEYSKAAISEWEHLVRSVLDDCGRVHLVTAENINLPSEHLEVHHFSSDCVNDLGQCPRNFSETEMGLFIENAAGRIMFLKNPEILSGVSVSS